MASHSSTLGWEWTEAPGGLRSTGSQSQTRLSSYTAATAVVLWRVSGVSGSFSLPGSIPWCCGTMVHESKNPLTEVWRVFSFARLLVIKLHSAFEYRIFCEFKSSFL